MKKTYIITIAFAALSMIWGCRKEFQQGGTNPQDGSKVVFQAIGEDGFKTNLDEFPAVHWDASDQIRVYAGSTYGLFTVKEGSIDGGKAEFEGEIPQADSYCAVYPFSAASGFADGCVTATIPSLQNIPVGHNVDPAAMLSVATSTGLSLKFKNVFALVKVTITGDDVTGIVVEGTDGEYISGTAEIEVSDTPETITTPTADFVDARPALGGCFAPGDYYIPVFPTVLSHGVKVGVRKSGSLERTAASGASITLLRNGGINCGSADLAAASKEPSVVLRRRADFDELSAGSGQLGTDGITLHVGNDIDMEGSIGTGFDFNGTFDGGNNFISNFIASGVDTAGLFRTVSGTSRISNVIFGELRQDGELREDGPYDGTSAISVTAAADTYVCAGLVAVVEEGASLSMHNVISDAKVTVSGTAKTTYMGGICGRWAGACTLENVCSGGNVTMKSTGNIFAGGLIGDILYGGTVTLEDCANNGDVTCSAATSGSTYLGGLIARGKATNQVINLDHCCNRGRILNSKGTGTVYVAGMIGNIGTGSSPTVTGKVNYTSCTNSGDVENAVRAGMRLAGFTASVYGVMTATDCDNYGAVMASQTNTTSDIGGYIGKNTGTAGGAFTRCRNYGAIVMYNATSTSAALAAGGIVGNSKSHTFTDCENYGNITVDNGTVKAKSIYAGGLAGYLSATATFSKSADGCKSDCSVKATSATTRNCGSLIGYGKTVVANNAGVGGSVNGTDLTSGNWKGFIFGAADTSTGVVTDGGSTSCYLIDGGSEQTVSIKVGNFNVWRPSARVSDRGSDSSPAFSEYRLWPAAVQGIAAAINEMNCDIIGFNELDQEVWAHPSLSADRQMPALVDALNGSKYTWQLQFPNYGDGRYSFCNGFAYDASKFDVLEGPVRVWLNNATGKFQTSAKDGARTLVYVQFREKASGKEFWFASTHLDLNPDEAACAACADACVDWATTFVDHSQPCILVGDMNCATVSTRPKGMVNLKKYWNDGYEQVRASGLMDFDSYTKPASRPGSSKVGTGTSTENSSLMEEANRYDHIMCDGCTAVSYSTNRGTYTAADGVAYWYSDHFPITAVVRL